MTFTRSIVAVIADMHGGAEYALMNPETILKRETKIGQEPYTPALTGGQEYLWECYTKDLADLKYMAENDRIIPILNGDLLQGNKHPSMLVSNRISDQVLIGRYNLDPLFKIANVKTARFNIGTAAHNFGEGSGEFLLVEQLKLCYKETNIDIQYHSLLEVDEYKIDCSHHGPYPGSREWLRGNVARLYLKDIMIRAVGNGEKPPDAVLRAHYHNYIKVMEFFGRYESWLFVSPSYSLLGDFTHQAARSPDTLTNGMFALEIVDGKLRQVHEFMRSIDIRSKEIL